MADPDQSNKINYQNRSAPAPSGRGRGRSNPSISKALHLFGVRDLREILDRKHHEPEQTKDGPPPDPSYSYLKDPLRENANEQRIYKYHKQQYSGRAPGDTQSRGRIFRESSGRGLGTPREGRHSELDKTSFIQNPINIKVKLVTSTGERSCKIDEDTKLADIKHVPNYKLKDLRHRMDGNGERNNTDRYRNERGNGRGQRGGRGERWRGRGVGRYASNKNNINYKNNLSTKQSTPDIVTNENWDKECIDNHILEDVESREEAQKIAEEEGEQYDNPDQEEDCEEGDEKNLETSEQNYSLGACPRGSNLDIEETLVVTSSENEEKSKRTVKFKLSDEQGDHAINQELKYDKKRCAEKELPKNEGDGKSEATDNVK